MVKCKYCNDEILKFQKSKYDCHSGCFDLWMEEGYKEMAEENLAFVNMIYGK